MHLELSVGLLESSAMLCVHVHASDASVGLSSLSGLPTRGSAYLVGKSCITDISDRFAGLFELPASLCMRVCTRPTCLFCLRAFLFRAQYCALDR